MSGRRLSNASDEGLLELGREGVQMMGELAMEDG
jgi:hypothetical protein